MHLTTTLIRFAVGLCLATLVLWMPQSTTKAAFQTDPACQIQLGTWQPAPPLPTGAYHLEGPVVMANGRFFIMSGYEDGSFNLGDRIDVFNMNTMTWENNAVPYSTTPFLISHQQAATDGQYIYMVGGFPNVNGSGPITTMWRYDVASDLWSTGAPLPEARGSGALAYNSVTNQLHYISGLPADRSTDQPDHWTLDLGDPAAIWVARANIPVPRNHFQAVEIDGKIYAVGGQQGHDGGHADTRFLHVYDPVTDAWTQLADMPISRSHHESATFVVNERIVIVAGSASLEGQAQVANVTSYNPQTDTWSELTPIPVPLYGAYAGYANGQIFVTAGGLTNFNLQQNSWTASFIEICDPAPVPQPTGIPPITPTPISAPQSGGNTVAQAPSVGVFDPALSKIGFLTPGQLGVQNERIEWVITATNTGTATGFNIVVQDTLRPELRIDEVTTSKGSIAITGQEVRVTIPELAPNESVQISIFTTVIADGAVLDNTACLSAPSVDEVCATGLAISSLPATGETPIESLLFQLVIGLSLLMIGLMIALKSLGEMANDGRTR